MFRTGDGSFSSGVRRLEGLDHLPMLIDVVSGRLRWPLWKTFIEQRRQAVQAIINALRKAWQRLVR
jgi:hypothetical protein